MKSKALRLLIVAAALAGLPAALYSNNDDSHDHHKKNNQNKTDDGVILIDQEGALKGGITPGDTPGFPVSITKSGSYRLASNLKVPDQNTTAILISADIDVTLDLNGFTIHGHNDTCDPGGGGTCDPGSGRGIIASGRTRIFNGTVKGMGSHGIFCAGPCEIARVRTLANVGNGIMLVVGSVKDSNSLANIGDGINVGGFGLVNGNIVDTLTLGPSVGYSDNFISSVTGGVNLGQNICGNHVCP